jgi:hypothetical protein
MSGTPDHRRLAVFQGQEKSMTNHPNRKKIYPDTTFEYIARKAGAQVFVLWEQAGPPKTEIAWHTCYSVNGKPAFVQTYKDGNGWNVFTAASTNDIDESIADALNRCGVPAPSFA